MRKQPNQSHPRSLPGVRSGLRAGKSGCYWLYPIGEICDEPDPDESAVGDFSAGGNGDEDNSCYCKWKRTDADRGKLYECFTWSGMPYPDYLAGDELEGFVAWCKNFWKAD